MSDTHSAIATSTAIRRPLANSQLATQRETASKQRRITRKLKAALDLMVFGPSEGEKAGIALAMDEAAREAGLSTRNIRLALDKPHVRTYLNARKHVFRTSACAQNISALVQLRDKSGNAMAQLGAIKVLEQIDNDPQTQSNAVRSPGFVIVVNAGPNTAKPLIELNPEPREE